MSPHMIYGWIWSKTPTSYDNAGILIENERFYMNFPEGDSDLGVSRVYRVTATALNVRSGPGVSYPVVRTLSKGTLVSVSSDDGSWACIGNGEYVSMNFIAPVGG